MPDTTQTSAISDAATKSYNNDERISSQALQRPKSWLPGLDLLRASAVFLVLLGHGKSLLDGTSRLIFDWIFPMPAAWGVEFFFALSGFLIGRQWLNLIDRKTLSREDSRRETRRFFAKRWLRTMPTYWLCLALYVCLGFSTANEPRMAWIVGNILLISSLINIPAAIPVSWTLAIEELSYLWIGLSAWIASQVPTSRISTNQTILIFPLIALATGTTARLNSASHHQWELIHHGTLQRIDALCYGILIAWAIRAGLINPGLWSKNTRIGAWLICVAAIIAIQGWCETNTIRLSPQTQSHALVFALFIIPAIGACSAAFTALLATQKPYLGPQALYTLTRATNKLAQVSYTVYLTHLPVKLFFSSLSTPQSAAKFLAYLCASLAVGIAAHPFIENPFMILRKRYLE